SKQVKKLLQSGHRLIEDQHFADAASRFRQAVTDDPQCIEAHANLGLALSKMKAWDAAAEEYRTAVALAPRDSVLHTKLTAAVAGLKRLDEAEQEALGALKLDSRNARAPFVLAGVLREKNASFSAAMPPLLAAQETFPSAKAAIEKICADQAVHGCPP